MSTKQQPRQPAKKPASQKPVPRAALRSLSPTAYSDSGVQVDAAAGVIKNVALATAGPALGHPFQLDGLSIQQFVDLANAQPDGVKSRFKHPAITEKQNADGNVIQSVADDTGSMVGRVKNVRLVGNQARGDVYLGSYAEVIPGLGNVRDYLLRHAQDDPAGVGMSAMFSYEIEPVTDNYGNVTACLARILELDAFDFVGVPASNPKGLLSAKAATFDPRPPSGWADPNPKSLAEAPLPVSTPDGMPAGPAKVLRALTEHGPQHAGGLISRTAFSGRLEALRADAEWLVGNGYAERQNVRGFPGYKATPKGATKAACCWNK